MPLSQHLLGRVAIVRSILPRAIYASNGRVYSTRPLSVLLDIPAIESGNEFVRPRRAPAQPQPQRTARPKEAGPRKAASNIELFDAIVHEGVSLNKLRADVGEACVLPNGNSVPLRTDERFADMLKTAYQRKNAPMAVKALELIVQSGYKPTSAGYLKAVETCAAAGAFDDVEDLLERYTPHIGTYERETDVLRSARTSVALAYLAADKPMPALRVLRWSGIDQLEDMELGKCEMGWGCLVRALTKSGDGATAVDVARGALDAGTPMSHSLFFYFLEAYRECGRWREADALLRSVENLEGGTENSILNATDYSKERAVGSVLRTITAPAARRFVDADRVVELASSISEPTSRFRTAALIALSSVGRTKEAREMYDGLAKDLHPNPPDERALSILIGGYCARIEVGAPDDADLEQWYGETCDEVDELWGMYRERVFKTTPNRRDKEARSRAFQRTLWTKSRGLRAADAADQLAEAVVRYRKDFSVGTAHFAAVLTGTELTCDVETLHRVLELMEAEYIPHDPRTLAFSVGAFLGGGNVYEALQLVREQSNLLLRSNRLAEQRDYRVALLVRRLDMLMQALDEKKLMKGKKEVYEIAQEFKAHLEKHSGPTRGWR